MFGHDAAEGVQDLLAVCGGQSQPQLTRGERPRWPARARGGTRAVPG